MVKPRGGKRGRGGPLLGRARPRHYTTTNSIQQLQKRREVMRRKRAEHMQVSSSKYDMIQIIPRYYGT